MLSILVRDFHSTADSISTGHFDSGILIAGLLKRGEMAGLLHIDAGET